MSYEPQSSPTPYPHWTRTITYEETKAEIAKVILPAPGVNSLWTLATEATGSQSWLLSLPLGVSGEQEAVSSRKMAAQSACR